MSQNLSPQRHRYFFEEGLITALSFGGVLILLGSVFALTPGAWQKVTAFFNDITTIQYPIGSSSSTVYLPAPAYPEAHVAFFSAVMIFCLGIGILQIIILALRLYVHSSDRRTAEAVGNLVFWFGAAISANIFLLTGTLTGWFQFWAALLLFVGVSLIARGIVYLLRR